MVPKNARRVLDVGCGSGDIARRLKEMRPHVEVVGLTHSDKEAKAAAPYMNAVHVIDLEHGLTDAALAEWGGGFDVMLFSHVLEHLSDPVSVLRRCLTRMQPNGHVIIAVPNVLDWRTRIKLLLGDFSYTDQGILDRTHMRFYTYQTASRELVDSIKELALIEQKGRGSMPLGPLRRIYFGQRVWDFIDRIGVSLWHNFCCSETAMLARWVVRNT
jgi:ubiquinone/menaquinone biosynthesis C-methylase UbiE